MCQDNREFVQSNYTTSAEHSKTSRNELEDEIEDMAIIAAYIDYIVNNNESTTAVQIIVLLASGVHLANKKEF